MKQVRAVVAAAVSVVLLGACARGASTPPTSGTVAGERAPASTTTYARDVAQAVQRVPVGSSAGEPRGAQALDRGTTTTASAVALAFARTACLYDTRIDRSPWDASRRAVRRYGTPSYIASLDAPAPDAGGQSWITLAAHDGYTVADATLADLDSATSDASMRALRQVDVSVRSLGARGWAGSIDTRTFLLTLVRVSSSDRWRVAGVQTF